MKQKLAKTLACVLAGTAIVFAGCGKNDDQATNAPSFDEVQTETQYGEKKTYNENVVRPGGTYGLRSNIAFLGADMTATSSEGEESYEPMTITLVATVEPADADQEVVWEVKFENPNSSWAKGKAVTDYLTLVQDADDSRNASVTCLKPFAEKIVIVSSAATNAEKKAECVVDFVQAPKSVALTFGNDLPINLGGETSVTWEINVNGIGAGGAANVQADMYDTYTIADEYSWDIDLISPYYYEWGIEYPDVGGLNSPDGWGEKATTLSNDYAFSDGFFRASAIGGALLGGYDLFLARQENITSWTLDYNFLQASKLSAIAEVTGSETVKDIYSSSSNTQTTLGSLMESTMYTLRLTFTGNYHTFEYLSLIKLGEYTNIAQVQAVSLSSVDYKF